MDIAFIYDIPKLYKNKIISKYMKKKKIKNKNIQK